MDIDALLGGGVTVSDEETTFRPGELLKMRANRRHWNVSLYKNTEQFSDTVGFVNGKELDVVVCLAFELGMVQVIVPSIGIGWVVSHHLVRMR